MMKVITTTESRPQKIEVDPINFLETIERLTQRCYILEMHLYHAGIVRYIDPPTEHRSTKMENYDD